MDYEIPKKWYNSKSGIEGALLNHGRLYELFIIRQEKAAKHVRLSSFSIFGGSLILLSNGRIGINNTKELEKDILTVIELLEGQCFNVDKVLNPNDNDFEQWFRQHFATIHEFEEV